MNNILLAAFSILILVSCGSQAASSCLGDEQKESVQRYECLNISAFQSLSLVQTSNNDNYKVELYSVDQEVVLTGESANYALVFSSFDIGEPAILIGLKSSNILRIDSETDTGKGLLKLVGFKGEVVFDVLFENYDSLMINNKEY